MIQVVFVDAGESPKELLGSAIAGSLIGTAAADALGWVTEFVRGRQHLRDLYGVDVVRDYRSWYKTSGGRFFGYRDDIGPGEYSDDTQLTLAVARSLNADGTLDPIHFANTELPLWLHYSRGAGSTITEAARRMARSGARWDRNFFSYSHRREKLHSWESGANGAAMRAAPIALANLRNPQQMEVGIWKSSIVTHGHPRAILGALLYAEAVRRAALLRDKPLRSVVEGLRDYNSRLCIPEDEHLQGWAQTRPGGLEALEKAWDTTKSEVAVGLDRVLGTKPGNGATTLSELGCFDPATKGSGVGTVLAALLIALASEDCYERAVVTAINQLGADTDTIGGFVGGILGAKLGYTSVPVNWARRLQDYEYLMRVSIELQALSEGCGIGGKALLPEPHIVERDPPDLLDLLKKKQIEQGKPVYHPLFGYGTVRSVESQALRRAGYRAYFAWVDFDLGQSCKFRYIKGEG